MRHKVWFALLALVVGVVAIPSAAIAEGWFSDMDDAKEVSLGEVLREPRSYVEVEVTVKVYFNTTGSSYNPYYTRFTEENYGNFSVWPIDARLYDKRDYQRAYGLFFVNRDNKIWKKLQAVERFTVVELGCVVRDVFRGQPWIEVVDWRKVSGGLDEEDIRNVIAGDAYFAAGRYEDAADVYDEAAHRRLPKSIRADVYRKLGDAYYRAGRYGRALDAYEEAQESVRNSVVLSQGVAASKDAIARERARRRGRAVPETTVEPAPHTVPVRGEVASDVDEIIRMLEDPAEVEAEVEAWRVELEKRAARARGEDVPVAAVGGDEAVEDVEAAPEGQESPEGCGVGVVEDEVTDESEEDGCSWGDEDVEEVVEDDVEEVVEDDVEEVVEDDVEEVVEDDVEEVVEGCGEEVVEGDVEEGSVDEDIDEPVVIEDDGVVIDNETRVVSVAGHTMRLPRLPFHGCEDVTVDEHRAVVEEIVRNPETSADEE